MSSTPPILLITGATGKVGRQLLDAFLAAPRFERFRVRALCHQRTLPASERLEIVRGSISDRSVAQAAMEGVTHVVHLATCKETPDDVIDVTVKGLFWLLEEARENESLERFVLLGGDAAMGHFFYPFELPVTETQAHSAYPGCYALSKVLEEVLVEQYVVQYELPATCLRAPWIMEKDDFKYSLSFGEDVFGGPRWRDIVGAEVADECVANGTVPVLCDETGEPIYRNFVHVHDLVDAILIALEHPRAVGETYNICMDEPVHYGRVAEHLAKTRGLPSLEIRTQYSSTWLDNAKSRFQLGFKPRYDLARLIDEAWDHVRPADDPRKTWYPG